LRLSNGQARYFQNWDDTKALIFRGQSYRYLPFPLPPLKRSIGEDATTISLDLPNVGSSEFGYVPLRDWAQQDLIENALIKFEVSDGGNIMQRHSFCVAERIFNEAKIELRLRQPDDGFVRVMTKVYDWRLIGETPNYSAFG
jgi:hypothetical protein